MATVTAFEAKTRFGELLERVAKGEEVVITRHDKPVARLVPEGAPRLDEVRRSVEGLGRFSSGFGAGHGRSCRGAMSETPSNTGVDESGVRRGCLSGDRVGAPSPGYGGDRGHAGCDRRRRHARSPCAVVVGSRKRSRRAGPSTQAERQRTADRAGLAVTPSRPRGPRRDVPRVFAALRTRFDAPIVGLRRRLSGAGAASSSQAGLHGWAAAQGCSAGRSRPLGLRSRSPVSLLPSLCRL